MRQSKRGQLILYSLKTGDRILASHPNGGTFCWYIAVTERSTGSRVGEGGTKLDGATRCKNSMVQPRRRRQTAWWSSIKMMMAMCIWEPSLHQLVVCVCFVAQCVPVHFKCLSVVSVVAEARAFLRVLFCAVIAFVLHLYFAAKKCLLPVLHDDVQEFSLTYTVV